MWRGVSTASISDLTFQTSISNVFQKLDPERKNSLLHFGFTFECKVTPYSVVPFCIVTCEFV